MKLETKKSKKLRAEQMNSFNGNEYLSNNMRKVQDKLDIFISLCARYCASGHNRLDRKQEMVGSGL